MRWRCWPRAQDITCEGKPVRIERRGPLLPDGVLEDDGAERGIFFVFIGADLQRQFEFVQSQWVNQGIFIGAPGEKDPIAGANDGTGVFTIPKQPVRRRLHGLSQFVTNRGGEYFFVPGLRALRWLADADDDSK
jgi:deferrochelatase/peroxidase EfeB